MLRREGRADVLPAGPVLPDEEGGPGHRLSASRPTARRRCAASRFTTRSSGRSIAARTRPSCTTGIRRPARASAASTATTSAAARRDVQGVHARRARGHVVDPTAPTAAAGSRSFELRGGANQLLPGDLRARASVNYFSSIATIADVQHQHLRRLAQPARLRRQRGRRLGQILAERHVSITREYFYDAQRAPTLSGNWPRIGVTRNERPLARDAAVFLAGGEYVHQLRSADHERRASPTTEEPEPRRFHAAGAVSVQEMAVVHGQLARSAGGTPSTRAACLRRSIRPTHRSSTRTTSIGASSRFRPTSRAGLQPHLGHADNGYAEKFKHAIEPFLNISGLRRSTTSIGSSSSTASTRSSAARRLHLRRQQPVLRQAQSRSAGRAGQAREIVERRAHARPTTPTSSRRSYDRQYQSNNVPGVDAPQLTSRRSRSASARCRPTRSTPTCARRSTAATTRCGRSPPAAAIRGRTCSSHASSWSKRGFIQQLTGFNDPISSRSGHQRVDDGAHGEQSRRRRSTRSTTTSSTRICSSSVSRASTTRSAAASRSSIRRYNCGLAQQRTDHVRPPLLHVVHARRPRQLLAVQRRARRRAPVARADAGHDSGHGRRRFCRQPPARSARGRGRRDRRLASARRRAARCSDRPCAGRRSICSIAAPSARPSHASRPSAVYHCAGGRARRQGVGQHRVDVRRQRARHHSSARCAPARRTCACSS